MTCGLGQGDYENMLRHLSSILTLTAACLWSHTPAYADVFRCDGAEGAALLFTIIAWPTGTRSTVIVKSPKACEGAECARDKPDTSESAQANREERAVDAQKRRRGEEQAAPLEWNEPEETVRPEPAPHEPLE